VPHADLVVHVRVREGDVRDHEVGKREPLDHLGDDQCANVMVGADGPVPQLEQDRRVNSVPKQVEIDPLRDTWLGPICRLLAERHDNEGDRCGHTLASLRLYAQRSWKESSAPAGARSRVALRSARSSTSSIGPQTPQLHIRVLRVLLPCLLSAVRH
jgi:hypothetical protein